MLPSVSQKSIKKMQQQVFVCFCNVSEPFKQRWRRICAIFIVYGNLFDFHLFSNMKFSIYQKKEMALVSGQFFH
jgi:hypothetical protein